MVMVSKRKLDFDVSETDDELTEASIYGRVVEMSPVKVSCKNTKHVEGRGEMLVVLYCSM